MNTKELIQWLEQQGTWVDWSMTRDHMVFGTHQNIHKVGVCWVATMQVIHQAIDQDIHFLISHENPFYHASTAQRTLVRRAIEEKQELLRDHHISIYRCHDVWDKIRDVGVADAWAKRLGFACIREESSYIQHVVIPPIRVDQLARHIADALKTDGEQGVYVFGNINRTVSHVGLGTGAATDIFEMLKEPCDVLIVADDGISNYYEAQYVIDQGLSMIVVNHAGCEIAGMKSMAEYLTAKFPLVSFQYLKEGYDIHYYLSDIQK